MQVRRLRGGRPGTAPGQRNRILDAFRHSAESGRKPWVTKNVGERKRDEMPKVINENLQIPANALCRTS